VPAVEAARQIRQVCDLTHPTPPSGLESPAAKVVRPGSPPRDIRYGQ
jgi:hypothetical protein